MSGKFVWEGGDCKVCVCVCVKGGSEAYQSTV